MKHVFYFVAVCMLAASVVLMQSCKKDDPDPDVKAYIENTWSVGTQGYIKQDGVDKTSEYPALSMTFSSNGTYTTLNGGKIFFPTGTWNWSSTDASQITLEGDIPVEVLAIDQTTLHIQFHLDPEDVNASGKTKAVVGDYEILFKTN